MTIEGWLRVDSSSGTVIERRRSADFMRSYSLYVIGDGALNFSVWYDGQSSVGIFSPPLPAGQLVHFAATLDDATGQMKMYVNGGLVSQLTTNRRPFNVPDARTYVGNINGITDELSVYKPGAVGCRSPIDLQRGNSDLGAAGKCLFDSQATIQFSSSTYEINENNNFAAITVTRSGDTSASASVKYSTADATGVNFNCNPATAGQITGAGFAQVRLSHGGGTFALRCR
jgi:hypothetical protein